MNPSRWKAANLPRAKLVFATATLTLLATACSKDAPLNFLHPEGPIARKADRLWDLTFGIAVVIFVLVEGALLFVVIKYRQKSKNDAPKQIHGNTRLEVIWTLIPVVLLAAVAIPNVKGIADLYAKPKGDPLEVTVVAHQWWWEYRYGASGLVTANELHIPVDRPVYLTLESVDVIHSFWVPKLAGKQDLVPGRKNSMTLIAEKPGEYLGTCAEYCGLSHANMRLKVFAHEAADFDEWLDGQLLEAESPSDSLAAKGEEVFMKGDCVQCHAIKGTEAAATFAPDLTHFASRTTFAGSIFPNDTENLRLWLRDAPSRKPGSKMPSGIKDMGLDDQDIEALIAYLQSLK